MCQIIVKPVGKKFNMKKLDKAQGWNEDGYGVTWFEDKELKTFKTMDYNRFKAVLSTLKKHKAIAHLRNTTRGTTCEANNHPFDIPSGVMFHNGTISSCSAPTKGGSDTQGLVKLIKACEYNYVSDITPLLQHIVGDTINRLVFFEDDGEITYVNKELGQEEDGIWYSNDYHERDSTREEAYSYDSKTAVTYVQAPNGTWVTPAKLAEMKKTTKQDKFKESSKVKVFVYGTLKEGESNHQRFLGDATKIGTAISVAKWAMIGTNMSFPYLLGRDAANGFNIKGEVYEVTKTQLAALDMLEGYPTHYKKDSMYVSYNDGRVSENVMVYVKATVSENLKMLPYIANFSNDSKQTY